MAIRDDVVDGLPGGIPDDAYAQAQARSLAKRQAGCAVGARYDPGAGRIVVSLHNGVEISVPVCLVEALAGAKAQDLACIQISPAGLGLHWPRLDADVYVPGLLQGILGSNQWMAAQLGAAGGKTRTAAKADAARANGRKGGRPRKAG